MHLTMLKRRRFLKLALAGILGGGGCLAYGRYVESGWFEVTHRKISGVFPKGLRILHLSDFHLSEAVPLTLIETAIDRALEEAFDLVCLTGDFITDTLTQKEQYAELLAKLSARAPCFACLGNHDGGAWAAMMRHGYEDSSEVKSLLGMAGVTLLVNESKKVSLAGGEIEIVGLGDYWAQELHPSLVMRDRNTDSGPVLLLSHNPDSKEALDGYDWDLMLCGHTHGGQFVVPLIGAAPFAPVRDKRFVSGMHQWRGYEICITRGVGNLHGLRINCRPEITILEA